jgi:sugar transferase (PEP-CTERM/EpsH1 system associated)
VFSLHKREGKDWGAYRRLYALLRRLRPDILHTRTMAALDAQAYGALAGVRARIHGEHGQVSSFMNDCGLKQRVFRHLFRPLIDQYIAVNRELADHLISAVGIPRERVTPIYNGVDTVRFRPRAGCRPMLGPPGFVCEDSVVIGTVGRAQPVKNQECLVRAFLYLVGSSAAMRQKLRLVLLGDGPLLDGLRKMLEDDGAAHLAWLPGERPDIAECVRAMDLFVLPSLGEGTSNTILEAMASGLPVVATRVGGNPELVSDGQTGRLVQSNDAEAIAGSILEYAEDPALRKEHGAEGRRAVEQRFSMKAMVEGYANVYEATLCRKVGPRR